MPTPCPVALPVSEPAKLKDRRPEGFAAGKVDRQSLDARPAAGTVSRTISLMVRTTHRSTSCTVPYELKYNLYRRLCCSYELLFFYRSTTSTALHVQPH
eukprot:scaffold3923_cov38-Prasinocladus_malaysianus.AAC.1